MKSEASQVHEWVVYRLGTLLDSVGHRVKIHKITPATDKEQGGIDYVVLQKTQEHANCLPPPHTLILDFTLTHTRYGRSIQYTMSTGQLTHTRCSDGVPEPDGSLQKVVRDKIRHYRQIYLDRPDPIAFMTVVVDSAT